jgi:hypothetical protein
MKESPKTVENTRPSRMRTTKENTGYDFARLRASNDKIKGRFPAPASDFRKVNRFPATYERAMLNLSPSSILFPLPRTSDWESSSREMCPMRLGANG